MNLLLGIDVGTSSTKGVLAATDGRILASCERSHHVSNPQPGWYEHDAEVWWEEISEIARELLSDGRARDLIAVCCSGMGPCVLLADGQGRPLRPALLYGIDTRAAAELAEIEARLGADDILARCGSPLTSQAAGPKLVWIQRHEPRVWDRAQRLLMPGSLAVLRLTGEYVLDHHSASQCAPMYELFEGRWNTDWAETVAPGLPLPRLLWPAEIAGEVTVTAAAATGIPPGTPVAAGTIDAWAEAVSVGINEAGELMLMYGSTMFMIGLSDAPQPDARLWLTRWVSDGRLSRAAGLATSGLLTEWFATMTSRSVSALTTEASLITPGSGGLIALPYFAGERTPLFDPAARGVLFGLQLGHERRHVFKALLEGTGYAVRHNFEAMREAGDSIEQVVAVGGGSRSSLWTQVVADITGIEQRIPRHTIGASFGDALLAAKAVGAVDTDEWNPIAGRVEPDPAVRPLYDQLYAVYRDLYPATVSCAHELARVQANISL